MTKHKAVPEFICSRSMPGSFEKRADFGRRSVTVPPCSPVTTTTENPHDHHDHVTAWARLYAWGGAMGGNEDAAAPSETGFNDQRADGSDCSVVFGRHFEARGGAAAEAAVVVVIRPPTCNRCQRVGACSAAIKGALNWPVWTQRYELHDDSNGFWSVIDRFTGWPARWRAYRRPAWIISMRTISPICSICWTSADEQKASPKAAS